MPYGVIIRGDVTNVRDLGTNKCYNFAVSDTFLVPGLTVTTGGSNSFRVVVNAGGLVQRAKRIDPASVVRNSNGIYTVTLPYNLPVGFGAVVNCNDPDRYSNATTAGGDTITVRIYNGTTNALVNADWTMEVNYDD